MAVEFYLGDGKERLRLPVNPEANDFVSPFAYDDHEVEGLGEVTTIKRRGLREFTISSFWPRDYNPTYCVYRGFIAPQRFYNQVENWRNGRQPIRLIVTGALVINIKVTIRDFAVRSDQFGSPGDMYYTLTLKEYRESKVATVDTSVKKKPSKGGATRPPADSATKVKSYTIKKDDSLWKIAALKSVYGKGSEWRRIYNANKKAIGANPNKLKVGMKLVIPR